MIFDTADTAPDPPGATLISERHDGATITNETAPGHARGGQAPPPLCEGDHIDRFVVLAKLGEGGMGTVVSAYDPQLDRTVAIKVLRPSARERVSRTFAALRLLREARAMAKLSHPNVVAVYEAGTHREQVYVAMEHVAGGTLRDWLGDRERGWAEVLTMFLQAGRGLEAAHEVQLVHRDFKPDNVLVDASTGRARVSDFGLAGASAQIGNAESATGLTSRRTVVGTPGYMAPEQHRGMSIDARADQFAFCVALYEALYGRLPFVGRTLLELRVNVSSDVIREPSPETDVPAWLHRVVVRGLRADPDKRYASMRDLLNELGDSRTSSRRWRPAVAVAGAIIGAISLLFMWQWGVGAPQCPREETRLDSIWNGSRQQQIAALFRATSRPYAAEMYASAAARIDAWTTEWTDAANESCRATYVYRKQTVQLHDRRSACLMRGRDALRAITDMWLTRTDGQAVDRALVSVASLPQVSRCGDFDLLTEVVDLPRAGDVRARVDAAQDQLADAVALLSAGKHELAQRISLLVVERSAQIGYSPLTAHAHRVAAAIDLSRGLVDSAIRHAYLALDAAVDSRNDELTALVWIDLLRISTKLPPGNDDALALRRSASLAVVRAGDSDELRARYQIALQSALHASGSFAEAEVAGHQALVLLEHGSVRGVALSDAYIGQASTVAAMGRYDDAIVMFTRALDHIEAEHPPGHPSLVQPLSRLGETSLLAARPAASIAYFERALAVADRALGAEHPTTATVRDRLRDVHRGLDEVQFSK